MSLVLLAPDMQTSVQRSRAGPRCGTSCRIRPCFGTASLRFLAIASQLCVGAWLVFSAFNADMESWRRRGPNAPKPPLYGIWTIDTHEHRRPDPIAARDRLRPLAAHGRSDAHAA